MKTFQIRDNRVVEEMSEGMLGDISFEYLDIRNSAIGIIHSSALLPSSDRLLQVHVEQSDLTEFPWDALHRFTRLPGISVGVISEIQRGFFRDMRNLRIFQCNTCGLGPTLQNGSFEFYSPALVELQFSSDGISRMESRAIAGFTANTKIHLTDNKFDSLPETSFRRMVEVLSLPSHGGDGYLDVRYNEIMCDCSIAWLVLNSDFRGSVRGVCPDGTSFDELDPEDFQECIMKDPSVADNSSFCITAHPNQRVTSRSPNKTCKTYAEQRLLLAGHPDSSPTVAGLLAGAVSDV
ncbi:unnamed protein product [Darwinula stevensoni]|uniref:Uncharacterized protein n=1 Tax=Darwinula stevensoni TaxID=69355 RepID=A0A7R9ADE1_9CRUS|nr:unnamed protein product [Darwinula stevensoni]CAG0901223.1 unnamed protein product [Darwinula stevensoni]